jgi:hypothetical protein
MGRRRIATEHLRSAAERLMTSLNQSADGEA